MDLGQRGKHHRRKAQAEEENREDDLTGRRIDVKISSDVTESRSNHRRRHGRDELARGGDDTNRDLAPCWPIVRARRIVINVFSDSLKKG